MDGSVVISPDATSALAEVVSDTAQTVAISASQWSELMQTQTATLTALCFVAALLCLLLGVFLGFLFFHRWWL